MKILVTGGAGFIGSHLVDRLLREGHQVRILDSLEPPTHRDGPPAYVPKEAEFIRGDVRNVDDLRRSLAGVEVIFHEAAAGGFTPHISTYIDSNVLGTARMLEVIRDERIPVKKIIVASSMGVYGEGKYACAAHGVIYPALRPESQLSRERWEVECPTCQAPLRPVPTDEATPTRPERAYSISKQAEERLILSVGMELGMPAVALRYFLTFGPRQSLFNPYTGVCSIFSTMLLNGVPPMVFEDGHQTRDFVFVEDVVEANLLVMRDERADFRVFNVGTGSAVSIREVVDTLAAQYGKPANPRVGGHYRIGDVRHLVADTSRIGEIGFTPRVTFKEGIRRYVEWIGTQGDVGEYFSEVEARMRSSGMIRPCASGVTK